MMIQFCAATAALGLFGAGLVAGPAAAADDTAVLTLDAALVKTLKKGKVTTTAQKPASIRAGAVTFPAAREGATVVLAGGLKMKKGKSVVTLGRLVVDPATGALDAEVGIKDGKNAPMALPVTGLMRLTGGTNQLTEQGTWSGATVKLAKSVTITGNSLDPAKVLGETLGVKIKKGATFGKLTITLAQ